MNTLATIISNALAGAKAPQTKAEALPTVPPLAKRLLEQFKTLNDRQLELMRSTAERFCTDVQSRTNPRWLSLLGPSGAGKTTLSRLIYRFVEDRARYYRIKGGSGDDVVQWHEVLWVNWRNAVREMRSGDFSIVDQLCASPRHKHHEIWLAVIDDVGSADDLSRSYILNAIDSIADARIGRWTVWSSNLTLQQIGEQLDPRIASRMIRGRNEVIEVDVPDFNLRGQ